ncbi:hypothetical protein [Actinokineospora enzanensis]|uniref:hypothetical protein n=1 Tax=Actinokineospora enzanensis TaxID=155975 RepID=UPI00035E0767|nr:hypothetical protein [Actinokineospora enzanensis]
MNSVTDDRLARIAQFETKLHQAIDTLSAVIEDPELSDYQPRRTALLDALNWLEMEATCGDCIEGRCHWGGEKSRASIAAAEAGREYVEPGVGRCGCGRHEISVQARQRRARLRAAGILS